MPHKRAKRSVREQQRSQKSLDLAPSHLSISQEPIPKSLARALNAAKLREEWRKRKTEDREEEKTGADRKKRKLNGKEQNKISKILPGESLQHYNKRVENDMRPLVKNAVHLSKIAVRDARRQELTAKAAKKAPKLKPDVRDHLDEPANELTSKVSSRPTEFETLSTSAPRRLNDIAQSPPELSRLPRGVSTTKIANAKVDRRDGVLSLAQKAMMEEEREKVIARYRELKAYRRKDRNEEETED
ncbi:hypothetical protein GG344DRAFT_57654 [Lentinula edodes]|nr:hypothetical protein GG344DRAFT_57654 [Lentinula edodes]